MQRRARVLLQELMDKDSAADGLERYLDAQEPVFGQVIDELRRGRKTSHWMWFIFPQIKGLGRSSTAEYFGLQSLEEAQAYAADPVLGPRLRLVTELVTAIAERSIQEILGSPDDLKFRSCMTLFARACRDDGGDPEPFLRALDKYFAGEPDPLTLARLPAAKRTASSGDG
jgi:uncharacterized protein (DUF1810 family)